MLHTITYDKSINCKIIYSIIFYKCDKKKIERLSYTRIQIITHSFHNQHRFKSS